MLRCVIVLLSATHHADVASRSLPQANGHRRRAIRGLAAFPHTARNVTSAETPARAVVSSLISFACVRVCSLAFKPTRKRRSRTSIHRSWPDRVAALFPPMPSCSNRVLGEPTLALDPVHQLHLLGRVATARSSHSRRAIASASYPALAAPASRQYRVSSTRSLSLARRRPRSGQQAGSWRLLCCSGKRSGRWGVVRGGSIRVRRGPWWRLVPTRVVALGAASADQARLGRPGGLAGGRLFA